MSMSEGITVATGLMFVRIFAPTLMESDGTIMDRPGEVLNYWLLGHAIMTEMAFPTIWISIATMMVCGMIWTPTHMGCSRKIRAAGKYLGIAEDVICKMNDYSITKVVND